MPARMLRLLSGLLATSSLLLLAQQPQPEPEPPLINSEIRTITGRFVPSRTTVLNGEVVRLQDACGFTLVLEKGQKAIEIRQRTPIRVSTDSRSCEAEFEVGTPSDEALRKNARPQGGIGTLGLLDEAHIDEAKDGGGRVLATVTSAGEYRTWVVDPINLTVNKVINYVSWEWDTADPEYCARRLYSSHGTDWLGATGWGMTFDTWFPTAECSRVGTISYNRFLNPAFCFGTATWVEYWPNHVEGDNLGNLYGFALVGIGGSSCVDWLSLRTQLIRVQ